MFILFVVVIILLFLRAPNSHHLNLGQAWSFLIYAALILPIFVVNHPHPSHLYFPLFKFNPALLPLPLQKSVVWSHLLRVQTILQLIGPKLGPATLCTCSLLILSTPGIWLLIIASIPGICSSLPYFSSRLLLFSCLLDLVRPPIPQSRPPHPTLHLSRSTNLQGFLTSSTTNSITPLYVRWIPDADGAAVQLNA